MLTGVEHDSLYGEAGAKLSQGLMTAATLAEMAVRLRTQAVQRQAQIAVRPGGQHAGPKPKPARSSAEVRAKRARTAKTKTATAKPTRQPRARRPEVLSDEQSRGQWRRAVPLEEHPYQAGSYRFTGVVAPEAPKRRQAQLGQGLFALPKPSKARGQWSHLLPREPDPLRPGIYLRPGVPGRQQPWVMAPPAPAKAPALLARPLVTPTPNPGHA